MLATPLFPTNEMTRRAAVGTLCWARRVRLGLSPDQNSGDHRRYIGKELRPLLENIPPGGRPVGIFRPFIRFAHFSVPFSLSPRSRSSYH